LRKQFFPKGIPMRLEDLLKPISADQPCGSDLEADGDDAYFDYFDLAVERLPTAYFNMARGTLFDPKSITVKSETAQIDLLLARSRDIRFLVLDAKFQILSTKLKGFADTVIAIAEILEKWPRDVHPRADADPTARRNALEELDVLATVVTPLEYAPLVTDRRIGDILFRAYLTGSGKATPREDEEPGDSSAIQTALASSDNAQAVDILHEQLAGILGALDRITVVCKDAPKPFIPKFDRLRTRLSEIRAFVLQARPDLAPDGAGGQADPASGDQAGATDGAGGKPGAAATSGAGPVSAAALPDHNAARALLEQTERYFARREPSSLALVLVIQARLLIGRPLVEALDALLEATADTAVIDLGNETGFSIAMPRMRQLSEAAGLYATDDGGSVPHSIADPTAPHPPPILSRDQAGQALKLVEEFFRLNEPASPIPILLFKARGTLNKDFHALIRELMPKDTD
jgi:type VI secretion system protein ImpA